VNGVVGVSGKEIELQGHFCKSSVAMLNSVWARSQFVKTPRVPVQSRQGAAARGRAFPLDLGRWDESGPVLLILFLFLFQQRFKNM
jgi:hypothetical protein